MLKTFSTYTFREIRLFPDSMTHLALKEFRLKFELRIIRRIPIRKAQANKCQKYVLRKKHASDSLLQLHICGFCLTMTSQSSSQLLQERSRGFRPGGSRRSPAHVSCSFHRHRRHFDPPWRLPCLLQCMGHL